MSVLPCGHSGPAAPPRMCPHLAGRPDGAWPGHVRLLTGRGIEFDLCCRACDQARAAGRPPELVAACAGCVSALADDAPDDMLGWRGAPGIAQRPEPLDPAVRSVPLPEALRSVADLAPVPGPGGSRWLALTAGGRLGFLDAETGRYDPRPRPPLRAAGPAPARRIGDRARPRLLVSARGEFAAIVQDYGFTGEVIDLATMRVTLTLHGGRDHCQHSRFAAAFIEHEGRPVIVHRTAWNRLDASDAATGELLTGRDAGRPEHYLPYFHGALYPSPDGHWIADDAWASGPTGIPLLWDARCWLADNPWESEDGPSWRPLCQRWYHWDKPVCWVADDLLAVSGIGSGEEAMLDGVRLFDAATGEEAAAFAGPRGPLFCDQRRLYSAAPDGTDCWDPRTGERTFRLPGFSPSRYHPGTGELAELGDTALRLWRPRPLPPPASAGGE